MFCSARVLHPISHGDRHQGDTSQFPPQAAAARAPLPVSETHLSIYTLCNNYFPNHRVLCASQPELLSLELAQLQTRLLSKQAVLG